MFYCPPVLFSLVCYLKTCFVGMMWSFDQPEGVFDGPAWYIQVGTDRLTVSTEDLKTEHWDCFSFIEVEKINEKCFDLFST